MSEDKSLLIVDDDAPFRQRLAQAMEKRGFIVVAAESVAAGIEAARDRPPAYAVVDLKLTDGNGLEVVKALREVRADTRIVVLTGYANIATAVAAVKTGAVDISPSRPMPMPSRPRSWRSVGPCRRRRSSR